MTQQQPYFQKGLAKLTKERKFNSKTYYKAYLLDAIRPQLYRVIKQHSHCNKTI